MQKAPRTISATSMRAVPLESSPSSMRSSPGFYCSRLHLSELAEAGTRSEAWRATRSARLHRARLLRSYLTQPFYVTEAFSGRAEVSIDRRRAAR